MIASSSADLAEMLEDKMFVQPIELRDSYSYELSETDARVGKKVIGSHVHRTNIELHGALNLHGRFQFRDLTFRLAPGVCGVNCAWGTHSTFDECAFVSLDENAPGVAGLWSDETADNNNSYGIHIAHCSFSCLWIGLQIHLGANQVVGGWTIRDTDFSSCTKWGIHARGVAALHVENCLFQNNRADAFLHGTEIYFAHCHAERQANDENLSVVIAEDSDAVLFLGGGMAAHPERVNDLSRKAIFQSGQASHAMLRRSADG